MSQIKTASEIAKNLFVVDQRLHEDGLTIQFIYKGKDQEIDIDPFEAAELLSKYGFVASANSEGQVLAEFMDAKDDEYFRWVDWSDFIRGNSLSFREATIIVCGEKAEQSMNRVVGNIKQIPALVKSILTPTKPAM